MIIEIKMISVILCFRKRKMYFFSKNMNINMIYFQNKWRKH